MSLGSRPDTAPALGGVALDHVALAVERWSDAWPTVVALLGGRWKSGGQQPGFAPSQYRFANGARLEVLAPWNWETFDFLRRFLDHSGPGPHHVTFKVPDIHEALQAVAAAGFSPTAVDLSDPDWMELFLHPKQAMGIVVQLAQSGSDWESPPPPEMPAPGAPAALLRVTHAVADLGAALALFRDLLGGTVTASGTSVDESAQLVELTWTGPLSIRLVGPAPGSSPDSALLGWLGGRPGRVHHLAFEIPAGSRVGDASGAGSVPSGVPDLVELDVHLGLLPEEPAPVAVLGPRPALGTRIVVVPPSRTL